MNGDWITPLGAALGSIVSGGVVLYFQGRWLSAFQEKIEDKLQGLGKSMDGMTARMDSYEKTQHSCQLANEGKYASKEDQRRMWARLDNQAERVVRNEEKAASLELRFEQHVKDHD